MDARSVDALTTALGARSGRDGKPRAFRETEEDTSRASRASRASWASWASGCRAASRAAAHDGRGPFSARLSTTLSSPTFTASASSSSADLGAAGVSGSASDITGAYPSSVGSRSSGASETVAVPSSTSAAYASLCHTSAATRGPAASAVARPMTPAPKSTCPSPFCRITSEARATAAGGLVRTGVAAAARGLPPSDTASSSSAGRDSLTTTDAVGKGKRRVDLKLRTSAVSVNRWVVSLAGAGSGCGAFCVLLFSRASVDGVAAASRGADAWFASSRLRLERGLAAPVSGASSLASCVPNTFASRGALGVTSASVAETRTSGDDAPLSVWNVADESLSQAPARSSPGAGSSAFCFIARMSTTAQPRRRWSSETVARGGARGREGGQDEARGGSGTGRRAFK